MEVESPCTDVCKIHQRTGHCRGCGRTAREIKAWETASDAEKQAILARLPERLRAMRDIDAGGA
jgi:predicted Fe-S protein YdhL (DUF1289 family)